MRGQDRTEQCKGGMVVVCPAVEMLIVHTAASLFLDGLTESVTIDIWTRLLLKKK